MDIDALVSRGLKVLELAKQVEDDDIKVVLLCIAAEALAAALILSAGRGRSIKKARLSLKRLFSTALSVAARTGLVAGEEVQNLKRILQALRCHRNRIIHPWLSSEKCKLYNVEEYIAAVEKLASIVRASMRAR